MRKIIKIIIAVSFLFSFKFSDAQFKEIAGTVADKKTTEPLEGVTIHAKRGNTTVSIGQTDKVGRFKLQIPASDSLLSFTILEYTSEQYKISEKQEGEINIFLTPKAGELDGVVIIGYQQKSRTLNTGSSTIVSGKDLQNVPVSNFMELLQGRVAGLNIQNNNGTPGMMGTVNIRGISSTDIQGDGNNAYLNPTSPLYVIDGIPFDPNEKYQYGFEQSGPGISPLSLIPVQDIEEIQVLKDAQATALYGSQGAYGVILITTKRGNSSVPIISYNGSVSVNFPPKLLTLIAGRDERMLRINQILQYDTSYVNALDLINRTPLLADSLNPYYNNATDWQSYFYRTTVNTGHNLSFSGGRQEFNYKVNAGYNEDRGIIENTGFTRYALSMSMSYRPSAKFSMSSVVRSGLGKSSVGSGNPLRQTGVADGANVSSLLPAPSIYTAGNDLLAAMGVSDDNKTGNVNASVNADMEIVKDLRFGTTVGYNYSTETQDRFSPGILNSGYGTVNNYSSISNSFYNRNSLSYTRQIKDHGFGIRGFNELSTGRSGSARVILARIANDQVQGPLGSSFSQSENAANISIDSRSVGFAGSFSYNYATKYVLDLSYRVDASSTSGPDAPWTKSPSVGLRWNIGKEKFFGLVKGFMDYASVRVSWGRNINPTGDVYDVYGRYALDLITYNGLSTISLNQDAIPNNLLSPSVSTTWNGGFETAFGSGLISLGFDTYYKQVDKQLRTKEIPTHNGFGGVKTNETSLVNYGYELSLGVRPFKGSNKVSWSFSVNGALNYDVLTKLPDNVRQLISGGTDAIGQPTLLRIGTNTFSNMLLHTRGVFATDDEVPVDPATGLRYRPSTGTNSYGYFRAGDPYWTDINGDYILDDNDFVIVGNSQPRFTGGMANQFQYGSFGFSFSVSATIRRDILNNINASRLSNFSDPTNAEQALLPVEGYSFWRQPGDVAIYPNPYDYTRYSQINPFRYNQTLFQEDGSYIKINSASFSYNFDKKFVSRFHVSSMRLTGSVNNIYTFSWYRGRDPENVSSIGRDGGDGYPMRRGVSLNLDIQF